MATVDTSQEWGNQTIRFRIVRKWLDADMQVLVDTRTQVKVRDPVFSVGLLGTISVAFTPWSKWKDFDALEPVDIIEE